MSGSNAREERDHESDDNAQQSASTVRSRTDELAKVNREPETEAKAWSLNTEQGLETFTANPFPTEEWRYTIDGRLVGLGYVDNLPQGLSAISFVWDPEERCRSLGTFNVLQMIEVARQRALPHVYLGYYVEGCRSLEYKARFQPNEILSEAGGWTPFQS